MPQSGLLLREIGTLPAQCQEFYENWLRTARLQHGDPNAIRTFAGSFPQLFGWQVDVAVNGYRHWLAQVSRNDSPEAFSQYCAPRYQRWRDTVSPVASSRP